MNKMNMIVKPAIQGVAIGSLLIASSSFASEIVKDDLITGSKQTTPWTVCDTDSTGIDISNLDAGLCAFRTTPAISGTTYKMSCGVVAVKFASITLAFLDASDTTLATKTTEIHEDATGGYSVTLDAPANTAVAAIGIYGEPGSGFQDCVLIDSTPAPEPTKGSIAGITWFDKNGDSLYTTSEPAVHGSSVVLQSGGVILEQTTTATDGSYYFGALDIDACYTVTFAPADPTLKFGAIGGDNDANDTGVTNEICLTEATPDVVNIDAPFVAIPPVVPPADYVVCGYSWVDNNTDGVANAGDALIGNVRAKLLDGSGKQIKSLETADGRYVFGSLAAGDYTVMFTTPDGHEPTVASGTPAPGTSYINSDGMTATFSLPGDSNTTADSACTIDQVNAGYAPLPVVLEPTIANNDMAQRFVGENFSVSFLDNDLACQNGVSEVDLLGHNVPGSVVYNAATQTFDVSGTTARGQYSIEYGIRGLCGSYDTATIFITLIEVIPPAPPAAPDAPLCRIETRGDTDTGGVDVFSVDEFGFASSYNLYDINRELVTTVFADDSTHKRLIGNDVNPRVFPDVLIGNYEIEWNGTAYGFDQTSIYFISAIENGVESQPSECIRTLISPIALDLENEGRIDRISGNYSVDVDGDGIKDAIGQWFGPTAGILVTADARGQIDGNHMFGNVPGVYDDGFAELATLDANSDGQISGDELGSLAIWIDKNSDTIVDEGELSTLASHEIASLAVSHYKFFARAKKHDGSSILMEDVWLPLAPMASIVK